MSSLTETDSRQLREILLKNRFLSRRSIAIGTVGTILMHLLAIIFTPDDLMSVESEEVRNPYKEYLLELAEEEEPEEEIPSYTQTNPDAPDNIPDNADNFAARNQQAAQEELPDEIDPDNLPSSESDDNIETEQFISGDLDLPELLPPPSPAQEAQEQTQPQESIEPQPLIQPVASEPLKQEIPIFGSLEENDPDETGVADYEFDKVEAPTNITDLFKGEAEEGENESEEQPTEQVSMQPVQPVTATTAQEALEPTPRPRPRLPKVAPGPIRNKAPGVSRTGRIAVDAKFSEFGEYLERLIEAISIRWNTLADDAAAKENDSMVRLRFTLTKHGYIEDLHLVDSTAKAIGIYMCRSAIEGGSPYGPWSEEMIAIFGDSEEITFAFYYH